MQNSDAEKGAKLGRFQHIEEGRGIRVQSCADLLSEIQKAARYLEGAIKDAGAVADVSLPKYPDKTTIVATFNRMLEHEMEYQKLASELKLPPEMRPRYEIRL